MYKYAPLFTIIILCACFCCGVADGRTQRARSPSFLEKRTVLRTLEAMAMLCVTIMPMGRPT